MATTTGRNMNGDSAAIATLGIRVSGLETRLSEISTTLQNIASSFSAKLEERSKTQWPLLAALAGVVLTSMAYLDSAKLGPLKDRDVEIVAIIKDLQGDMKVNMVPQWVHQREWNYRDQQFKAQEDRAKIMEENMAQRVKRMEDMFGSTWSIRDAITTFQQRMDRFEQALPKN